MLEPEAPNPPEPPPNLPTHLRPITDETRWIRILAVAGVILLALVLALTFLAPSVLWFLAYPLLIAAALAALSTAAAFLLRRL